MALVYVLVLEFEEKEKVLITDLGGFGHIIDIVRRSKKP
jgi:hypothetical protein